MVELEWVDSDSAEVFNGLEYLGFVFWEEGEWIASTADFNELGGFTDEMQAASWLASS